MSDDFIDHPMYNPDQQDDVDPALAERLARLQELLENPEGKDPEGETPDESAEVLAQVRASRDALQGAVRFLDCQEELVIAGRDPNNLFREHPEEVKDYVRYLLDCGGSDQHSWRTLAGSFAGLCTRLLNARIEERPDEGEVITGIFGQTSEGVLD